jgi:dTDP-4-amino-4,6-dideoxygalactose transaminase
MIEGRESKGRECEARLAGMSGREGAVLASRATVGLAAVLRALGLPKGSGVLMPVMCCANVVHAVRGAGLQAVFVDMEVGRFGFGMDLGKAERAVEEHGKARLLLAVPLFGGGVDVEGLEELAERHGLMVVEDAAQCGVRIAEGRVRIGGVASVYSFGVGKIGDAGGGAVVVSDDVEFLGRVRGELKGKRDLGERAEQIMGSLDGLDAEVAERRRMAEAYLEGLKIEGVEHPGGEIPLWKYSLLMRDRRERDRVTSRLIERGVQASNLYAPLSRWFGHYGDWGKGEFAVAWSVWERIINLPLWPERAGLVEDVLWAFREVK